MKNLSTLIIALTIVGCQSKSQTERALKLRIDSLANVFVAEKKVPSIAVGIVKDGEVVLETAYGYADLEKKELVDATTLYQLGSITKMFTGRVLANLIYEGRVSMADTLEYLFPGTVFPKSTTGQWVTIQDAATHSGEFPAYPANLDRIDPDPILGYSRDDLLEGIEMMRMDTTFGSQFYYSNFGYGVLGTALENLTGRSLSNLMQEYIFTPFKMTSTSLLYEKELQSRLATPYLETDPIRETSPWEMEALAGAGNAFSSVTDLNRFLLKLLEQDTINKIQLNRHFQIHDNWYYGLGCFLVDVKGENTQMIFHGSDNDGYAGNLAIYPEYDLGYVILTNWGEGQVIVDAIKAIEKSISEHYVSRK